MTRWRIFVYGIFRGSVMADTMEGAMVKAVARMHKVYGNQFNAPINLE